jgi:hypothetical protein
MSGHEPHITVKGTSNPETAMFVLDRRIGGERSRSYLDAESASHDPLASSLFAIFGVRAVLFVENSIWITKTDGVEWSHLAPRVEAAIRTGLTRTGSRRHLSAFSSLRAVLRILGLTKPAEKAGDKPRSPPNVPGAGFARMRVQVPADARAIVAWILLAASLAQLLWQWIFLIPGSLLNAREPVLSRLGITIGLFLLWIVFTKAKEQ